MTTTPFIDATERRRRIAVRHHLAPACRAADLVALVDDVVGIHATDPISAYLGIRARAVAGTRDVIARALYEERSLLRIMGMRRTMFVASRANAAVIQSAVSRKLGEQERKRLIGWIGRARVIGDGDAAAWLSDVEARTAAALDELGEATAAELTKRVPALRVRLPFGEGRRWGGEVGVSTRILFLLATEGRIVRGRPRGTWQSSLYAWAPIGRWLEGGLDELPLAEAQASLVTRYLRAFGPATLRDVQWWTGLTVREIRHAVVQSGAMEVGLDGASGYMLADDLEATPATEPWVALLPGLDTTTMGWADRDWYLAGYRSRLFDTNGNAGPTVWVDGRAVGGWGQRREGQVVFVLFEDVGRDARRLIEQEADLIREFAAESRIIPRFRTPTEVELGV